MCQFSTLAEAYRRHHLCSHAVFGQNAREYEVGGGLACRPASENLVRLQLAHSDAEAESEAGFLLKGFNLRYHNMEAMLFTTDPYNGNLN